MVKPKASSTPKIVDISRRRPIGYKSNDSVQSPIVTHIPKPEGALDHKYFETNSGEESEDYIDSNDETDNSNEERINTTFCNCINPSCLTVASIVFLIVCIFYIYPEDDFKVTAISTTILSQEFPSQVEDFWIYIEEGIADINKFHLPRTFVFLYNDESQKTLEKILPRITEFATCTLTSCAVLPVILEANDLSTSDILKDYGKIISNNKDKLEKSGVMIVKNLEKVPGVSAQAFHSFCDEYNPVVEKALFIFTMKVDTGKLYANNVKYLEKYLRDHWKDIKDDKFYPLFTRIANIVLPIMAEK